MELEVYDALGIRRNEYFQGHYLKSVTGVEKKVEKVQIPVGWFYVSTAQPKGNLISYMLEPETDDNLITWGYTDNLLRVQPASVQEAMADLLGDTDPSSLTPDQRAQVEKRAQQMMNERQRVPMIGEGSAACSRTSFTVAVRRNANTSASGKLCCSASAMLMPSSVAAACSSKLNDRQNRLRSARPQALLMRAPNGAWITSCMPPPSSKNRSATIVSCVGTAVRIVRPATT